MPAVLVVSLTAQSAEDCLRLFLAKLTSRFFFLFSFATNLEVAIHYESSKVSRSSYSRAVVHR